jgi:hypothetical protein
VTVRVSDGPGLFDDVDVTINVTDVVENSAPTITSNGGGASASTSIAENATAVTTVQATDPDAGTTLVYSISGGADAAKFAINASSGALTFVSAPNFEAPADADTNNVYDVIVRAYDGALFDDQAIAVTVTDVNTAPVINSNGGGNTASISISENTTAVTTVTASDDGENTNTKVFSIVGGADAARFTINASTGALRFLAAPDFENPTDSGLNNVYDVTVQASDGVLVDTQALAVTVTNAAETLAVWVTSKDTDAKFSVRDILRNDGTTSNDSLTLVSANSANFAITYDTAGNITFHSSSGGGNTPTFDGTITYQLSDGSEHSVNIYSVNAQDGEDLSSAPTYQASYMVAGPGGKTLTGAGIAFDYLVGGQGGDNLIGGSGNDVLRGGAGNDAFDGGGGLDLLDFSDASGSISFTLAQSSVPTTTGLLAGIGNDTYSNMEGVIGSNFGDTLVGSGNAGVGDVIIGGGGKDTMTGNAGGDTFVFRAITDSGIGANADLITDFKSSGADIIDLFGIDADVSLSGDQAFAFISSQDANAVAHSVTWSQTGGNTIVRADVNGDTTADFEILLTGLKTLTAADFIL